MKAVILAGGYGTRISEESTVRPKPMVVIGERPILSHNMKLYAHWHVWRLIDELLRDEQINKYELSHSGER